MALNAYKIQGFRGGIADDPYKGVRESFRFGYGLNIREEENTLKCNQALKKDSGDIVTDLINFFVPASNGQLYGFGSDGCIYRKATPAANWEKVYTDANGEITGAAEYTCNDGADNYIPYLNWATETKVSRIKLSKADEDNWAADVEHNWKSLNGDPSWHTMKEALGVLLICDAQNLAMVDYEGGFNLEALDVPKGHRHKCLLGQDQLVLIGSHKGTQIEEGWLWTWDKIQPSWIQRRKVAERGINAMIQGEVLTVQAGIRGGLYFWDTATLMRIKKFPGTYGWVNPGAVCDFGGLPLYGLNGSEKCGIYSYGRLSKNDPYALNLEYVPSHGKMEGVYIGALAVYGDKLFASIQDGEDFWVDTIDPNNKAEARYEGLVFDGGENFTQKGFRHIKLVTKPLPADTSIEIFYKVNQRGDWQKATMQDGAEQFDKAEQSKAIFTIETGGEEDYPHEGEEYELAMNLHPNGNNTPEVISATTYFEPLGIL